MKLFFLFSYFFLLFLLISQSYLYSQFDTSINIEDPDKIVELMENRYNSYETYSANFKEINQGKLRLGKIFYKKPNQIRIQYFQGENLATDIFFDGKKLYLHFTAQYIVFEQEATSSDKPTPTEGVNPLYLIENYNFNFLETSGLVDIFTPEDKKSFFILAGDPSPRGYSVSLTPKDIELGLNKIILYINQDGDIVRNKSTNIAGKVEDQYYYDIVINEKIDPEIFTFVIPNQVRLIKNFLKS